MTGVRSASARPIRNRIAAVVALTACLVGTGLVLLARAWEPRDIGRGNVIYWLAIPDIAKAVPVLEACRAALQPFPAGRAETPACRSSLRDKAPDGRPPSSIPERARRRRLRDGPSTRHVVGQVLRRSLRPCRSRSDGGKRRDGDRMRHDHREHRRGIAREAGSPDELRRLPQGRRPAEVTPRGA